MHLSCPCEIGSRPCALRKHVRVTEHDDDTGARILAAFQVTWSIVPALFNDPVSRSCSRTPGVTGTSKPHAECSVGSTLVKI